MLSSSILITPEVYDFMFIKVNDPLLCDDLLEYRISDMAGQQVRKGHFRGVVIQLRLTHLEDGAYRITVSTRSEKEVAYEFTKKTASQEEHSYIRF